MDDFPNIPEVDEYRSNPWGMCCARGDGVGCGGYVDFTPKILADAAVAALEARVAERDRMLRLLAEETYGEGPTEEQWRVWLANLRARAEECRHG